MYRQPTLFKNEKQISSGRGLGWGKREKERKERERVRERRQILIIADFH